LSDLIVKLFLAFRHFVSVVVSMGRPTDSGEYVCVAIITDRKYVCVAIITDRKYVCVAIITDRNFLFRLRQSQSS
jgi:hypothetical protein